jgi:hypothetical protein
MFELPTLEGVTRCLIDTDGHGRLGTPRLLSSSGQVVEIHPRRGDAKSA